MRFVLPSILIFLTALSSIWGIFVTAQEPDCAISENYYEAVSENTTNVLRMFAFLGDDGIWDSNPDNINLYYGQLVSMRTYYEESASNIPPCAQEFNRAHGQAVSAMGDILAYNWALQANPDQITYLTSRANMAKERLNEAWSRVSDLNRETSFVIQ